MARAKVLLIILLAFLICTGGLVSILGQTQDKPKTQTTEVKKCECTDCKDCNGKCSDCKGTCKDCKGHGKGCTGQEKCCKGQCANGHEKKAAPPSEPQNK